MTVPSSGPDLSGDRDELLVLGLTPFAHALANGGFSMYVIVLKIF